MKVADVLTEPYKMGAPALEGPFDGWGTEHNATPVEAHRVHSSQLEVTTRRVSPVTKRGRVRVFLDGFHTISTGKILPFLVLSLQQSAASPSLR